jgi:hypothetical protein
MSEPRPPDLNRYTYGDPFLSLWQSAAKEVRTSQESTSFGNALEIGQGRGLMWPARSQNGRLRPDRWFQTVEPLVTEIYNDRFLRR